MDKVTRQCPQTTTFLKRKESRSGIEPMSFRLPAYRLTARPSRLTYRCGGRGRLYTDRYTVTTRMTPALKMGSDESHFNVSLIVRDKVTRQCPQTTAFEEKGVTLRKLLIALLLF